MNDETNSSGMASLTGPAFERPDLAAFKSDAERAQWIRATVAKMDSPSDPAQCDYTDRNIQLVCFLIGAFLVGDDEQRIARMLGHDPRVQAEWIRNLRQNGLWPPFAPAVITPNNFKYKSLSNWAFNIAVGCSHGCRFCYVPSTSTNKQAPRLADYGVEDPDSEWGDYLLLRPWDEEQFLSSLQDAESTPLSELKPDGNRAVIYCSTTDPYQVIHHSNPEQQRFLSRHARFLVRRSLELIRDKSTLNVRILTRSPLARADFELFKTFGKRLLFGMSIPTLNNSRGQGL